MTILALDASTKSTGYAIYKDSKLIESGCIAHSSSNLYMRIKYMIQEIEKLLEKYSDIEKIVLEEVRPEEKGQNKSNFKTFKALMYLQGGIALMLYDKYRKVTMDFMYPSEWRSKCGIHTGPHIYREQLKRASIDFTKTTFGLNVNDDEADAIGIGYAYTRVEEPKNILC